MRKIKNPDPLTFAINQPVMVRNLSNEPWKRRYVAKVSPGHLWVWLEGGTSWSSEGRMLEWGYWRLPTEKELPKEDV